MDFSRARFIKLQHHGLQSRLQVHFYFRKGVMKSLSWQRIASGIALIAAAISVVALHEMNYTREIQLFAVALVSVSAVLFLSGATAAKDEFWWW
jgi:hypothetical protein